MTRYTNPIQYAPDGNGQPRSGALLYFFEPGTTTLKSIYSDSDFQTVRANPVVADSNGLFAVDIFINGAYKVELRDAADVTIWTVDPVESDPLIISGQDWDTSITYGVGDLVKATDNELYRSKVASNQGNNPTSSPAQWDLVSLVLGGTLAGKTTYTGLQAWGKGADVASAPILPIGNDGNHFQVTGTSFVSSIGTKGVGTIITLRFSASLEIVHNATTMILPKNRNINTEAGDVATFLEYSLGNWLLLTYNSQTSGGGAVPKSGESAVTTLNSNSPVDFTGIPDWANRIIMTFHDVSLDTNGATLGFQLLTNGTPITSGYISNTLRVNNAAGATGSAGPTDRIELTWPSEQAAEVISGQVVFENYDDFFDRWIVTGQYLFRNSKVGQVSIVGFADGTGTTGIRALASTGHDFDGGSMKMRYE